MMGGSQDAMATRGRFRASSFTFTLATIRSIAHVNFNFLYIEMAPMQCWNTLYECTLCKRRSLAFMKRIARDSSFAHRGASARILPRVCMSKPSHSRGRALQEKAHARLSLQYTTLDPYIPSSPLDDQIILLHAYNDWENIQAPTGDIQRALYMMDPRSRLIKPLLRRHSCHRARIE
jgi:hypothetical protein